MCVMAVSVFQRQFHVPDLHCFKIIFVFCSRMGSTLGTAAHSVPRCHLQPPWWPVQGRAWRCDMGAPVCDSRACLGCPEVGLAEFLPAVSGGPGWLLVAGLGREVAGLTLHC